MARRKTPSKSNDSATTSPVMEAVKQRKPPSDQTSSHPALRGKSTDSQNADPEDPYLSSANQSTSSSENAASSSSDLQYLHKKFKKHSTTSRPPEESPLLSSLPSSSSSPKTFVTTQVFHRSSANDPKPVLYDNNNVIGAKSRDRQGSSFGSESRELTFNGAINPNKLTQLDLPYVFQQQRGSEKHPQLILSQPQFHQTHQEVLGGGYSGMSERDYDGQAAPGKYICPYCKLACTKPSVLEKHIRAHTNERPYPCTLCGFAFKTKSNLHKHFKSRAHLSRERGEEPQGDDEGSIIESDSETTDKDASNSGFDTTRRISPFDDPTSSPSSIQSLERPYKPKFHLIVKNEPVPIVSNQHQTTITLSSAPPSSVFNLAQSEKELQGRKIVQNFHNGGKTSHLSILPICSTSASPSNPAPFLKQTAAESLEKRIQDLISQNSAIIEGVEPPLQKKYHKICGLSRQLSLDSSSATLTTPTVSTSRRGSTREVAQSSATPQFLPNSNVVIVAPRTPSQPPPHLISVPAQLVVTPPSSQPLNLTKSADVPGDEPPPSKQKKLSTHEIPNADLVTVLNHPQNPERSIIKDLLLNSKQFGVVEENGEVERLYVCKFCNLGFQNMDLLKYHIVVHCGDKQTASPLASPKAYLRPNSHYAGEKKMVRTPFKPGKAKPDNIVINHSPSMTSPVIEAASHQFEWKTFVETPLPSPGPLLGKTRLVDVRPMDEGLRMERKLSTHSLPDPEIKRSSFKNVDLQRTPPDKLQMFGGEVKILDKGEEKISRYSSGGTMSTISREDQEGENTVVIRTGLHSGGVAVQIEKDKNEKPPMTSLPNTPKLVLTITPTLTITQPTQAALMSSHKSHFQFPPINAITGFNPLTLGLASAAVPDQPSSIMHGGKSIPYVPGIPGPNTLINLKLENTKKALSGTPIKESKDRIWSPAKQQDAPAAPEDVRIFNFENLIAKNEIIIRPVEAKVKVETPEKKPNRFLRPTSLPLKPGTFTPKQHHGITPNANTLPLISPETPRISKSCVQLYLNGHAYTFLGLKCSTKPFYCTVSKPQPAYIVTKDRLSMYSNWQIYPENNPHPLSLKPASLISLYDSRQRSSKYSVAPTRAPSVAECSFTSVRVSAVEQPSVVKPRPLPMSEEGMTHDEEVYVRGRGRGKYVCEECGIRCKKPSMLKKHIRTHTDVRPYTCINCNFSFKTKGNLTKHMKSKAHYKKCIELGIPVEEYTGGDYDPEGDQLSVSGSERHSVNIEENDDSDNDSDNDGEETESDDTLSVEDNIKTLLPEHEAARCLLSLSMTPPAPSMYVKTASIVMPKEKLASERPPTLSELESRRIITFSNTTPKESFDLRGQYYSDPHVRSSKSSKTHSDTDDAPIDLTKKPDPVISDVVVPVTEAGLLASLVSNADRVPAPHYNGDFIPMPIDEALFPKKYITDLAMQDSKMKQSQVKRVLEVVEPEYPQYLPEIQPKESGTSMMDTLAEVAASSLKLDIGKLEVGKLQSEEKATEGAKNVASEYLKLASKMQDGEESSSDQEAKLQRSVVVGKRLPSAEIYAQESGRPTCRVCKQTFQTEALCRIHVNIHYMERKFKCETCLVSFRSAGLLQKHERSAAHRDKVSKTLTFGVPNQTNPRPFKCKECKSAFRIHGHLAKHLRSKLHVLKLECLQKLPFGTYAEIERNNISLTSIETSDCESSLASLQALARDLHAKDPTKLGALPYKESDGGGDADVGDTEEGDSEDEETLENIQNEPDNGLKRKLSEIENSLGHSPLNGEEHPKAPDFLLSSPKISPLQSMQRMSPAASEADLESPSEKRLRMSPIAN